MATLVMGRASAGVFADEVMSPESTFAGKSVAQCNAAWWTWAWNSPAVSEPLGDTSGALANQNNGGPVLFLAGSNFNGNLERSFDVLGGVSFPWMRQP